MLIPFVSAGLIYADPPWDYEMYSSKGYKKSPQVHYKCMKQAELLAMRDSILFATGPNAVIFMWAVWPKIDEALELMAAWGFKYKTGGAWQKKTRHGKTAFGTGYIMRSACEPFLIGTCGNPKFKNKSTRNFFDDKVRGHSRKPDSVYGKLEKLCDGPYLELFARQSAPNWIACGNEVDKFTYGVD